MGIGVWYKHSGSWVSSHFGTRPLAWLKEVTDTIRIPTLSEMLAFVLTRGKCIDVKIISPDINGDYWVELVASDHRIHRGLGVTIELALTEAYGKAVTQNKKEIDDGNV